jgi:hypothetical protein
MRWLRHRRKFGGLLALFALALQLGLSFGHIHTEELFGSGRAAPSASVGDHARWLSSDQRTNQTSSDHSDDYCAICATTYLLSSSFVPKAPQPLPPTFISRPVEHSSSVAAIFVAPRRAPFQSRAPPSA